jgi:hypothetical protein
MIESAWLDIAPRISWSVAATAPRRRIFVVLLRADGLADYELPVSSINLRLRNVKASYVRVTVPNPTDHTDAILARTSGRMHIYSGWLTDDGARHLEELIYANVQNVYFNQGSSNVLILAGTRYMTRSNPRAAAIDGVSQIRRTPAGRVAVTAPLDFFVQPGDVASGGGESFTVDYMGCAILPPNAWMEIEGAANG